jgi:hypothetical protein
MELEILLGLWVWSLMADPTAEERDELSSRIRSRALEVPVRRIVSTAEKIENLKAWLPRNAFNFKEHTINFDDECAEPGSLWSEAGNEYKEYNSPWGNRRGDIIRPLIRPFGWNTEGDSSAMNLYNTSGKFKMLSAASSGTLVSSCADEVFASFLTSVLDKFTKQEDARIEVVDGDPHLRSPLVEKVVKAFTDSQLGSAEEAMLCVLPPIISRLDKM